MFSLIPISLLIMALGGAIYIVSNHLSEFSDKGPLRSEASGSPEGGEDKGDEFSFGIKAKLTGWINRLPWDNMKVQSFSFTQKFLHRLRIVLLKTDNRLMDLIRKISEKDKEINGNGNEKKPENNNDFWDDLSRNKQESNGVLPTLPRSEPEPEPVLKTKIEFADVKNNKPIKKVDGILTNRVSKRVGVKPIVKKIKSIKRTPR